MTSVSHLEKPLVHVDILNHLVIPTSNPELSNVLASSWEQGSACTHASLTAAPCVTETREVNRLYRVSNIHLKIIQMAGAEGFEPSNDGTKKYCGQCGKPKVMISENNKWILVHYH